MAQSESKLEHLAVIMDGNSRWAKEHKLPKFSGYRKGAEVAKDLIKIAVKYNIRHLTLYAFSEENWSRPSSEVSGLLKLFNLYLTREISQLHQNNVKLEIIGDIERLPENLRKNVRYAVDLTANNDKLCLYIAFSYGGRQELLKACQLLIKAKISPEALDIKTFQQFLYAPFMPDVDLIIRTGGEKRTSNFLLWHAAYAELYFIDKYWPDFQEQDLIKALNNFNHRTRNFGKARVYENS